jgi:hypothetical protein
MGDRRVGARLAVPDAGSSLTTAWERPSGHSEATPRHTLKTDESEFLKDISTLLRARWKPLAPKKILMIEAALGRWPDKRFGPRSRAVLIKISERPDARRVTTGRVARFRSVRLGDAAR